jgi:hypothetical protein
VVKNTVFLGGSRLSAQTYSSFVDVQKVITLKPFVISGWVNNRWKESSITLEFGSRSDFPQSIPRFALTDFCLQSSHIQRRCRNFRFEVFLVDLRMDIYCGVSTS